MNTLARMSRGRTGKGKKAHMMAIRCVRCAKYIRLNAVKTWPVHPDQLSRL